MGTFIHYRELRGYKYALALTYSVELPELSEEQCDHPLFALRDGTLIVQPNYCWDGPSGPTIDSPSTMRASLIHDVLYQAMRIGLLPRTLRSVADDILYRCCREDGMGRIRAWAWFRALSSFGAPSVRPRIEKIETIHTAPASREDPTSATHIKKQFRKLGPFRK